MRTVLLIGTSHEYQWPRAGPSGKGSEKFRSLVDATCWQNGVKALAEEMSLDALQLRGVSESICKQVADALGISHRYCDPSLEEQRARGIVVEDDIRLRGFFSGQDPQQVEAEVRASSARRRQYWLEQLLELDSWPLVFVCGADHVEPFHALLQDSGILVRVLFTRWVPYQ